MTKNIKSDVLKSFIKDVFISLGVPNDDAQICADMLAYADLHGIDSHGVNRLGMYYRRIKRGTYNVKTEIKTINDKGSTAVLDGGNGMGHVIGKKAMELTIEKAKEFGTGAVAVRNSTHFGVSRLYTEMAIDAGMLGFIFTNARPAVAPTFGVEPLLGTNPITFGCPTDEEFPFVIDCATSTIQRGDVEVSARKGEMLGSGLVIDEEGKETTDSKEVLENLMSGKASLLPLGGMTSGYKGYGYSTMVEILSSALQEGVFLRDTVRQFKGGKDLLNVGHFFLAVDISHFISIDLFKKIAGSIMRELRNSKKAPGQERIYTAGEMEFESKKERLKKGIPVNESIIKDIKKMQSECGLEGYDFGF